MALFEFGDYSYQEITLKEKLLEVLSYLLRIGDFKQYAGKTILNNVYMDLRGKKPVFKRTKTAMERNNIFATIRRYAKKLKPQYNGDVYLETVRCYFDISQENLEKCRYTYQGNETYAFLISEAMKLLYPHMVKFYSFIDFSTYVVQGSTNYLTHYLKAFIAAGIRNRIIALYDNDSAGLSEIKVLKNIPIPSNVRIMHLPDLEMCLHYPTIGPGGSSIDNIILYTFRLLHCSYAKSIDKISFSAGRRACYNEIFSFLYPMAGAQPFYCLGVKLTFRTVNGFVKICRRVSQMRFFH